ncbi:MAG: aldehyde dehydrogenase family protein, partial [Halalkalicoccus sp.]
MESTNPATGETVATYDDHDESDVDAALDRATERFEEWRDTRIETRQVLLANAADVLRESEDRYAELITEEMGKPIAQSRSEVEKCAWACEFYSERADEFLADDVLGSDPETRTLVSYEPLGVVLSIMPWNFPFWQVFRFAAPNLTAGNVGVFKHASNVPGCAMAIQEVFEEAGCPEDVFQTL